MTEISFMQKMKMTDCMECMDCKRFAERDIMAISRWSSSYFMHNNINNAVIVRVYDLQTDAYTHW